MGAKLLPLGWPDAMDVLKVAATLGIFVGTLALVLVKPRGWNE
ncbi:MAG: hypothetical protein K0S65_5300, partial [Labilithrix sp.]|nr:hypothetical protein [Labilithrix sp.]